MASRLRAHQVDRRRRGKDRRAGQESSELSSPASPVRDATPQDLPRIAEIKVRNWADTYGPLVEPGILRPFLDTGVQLGELRQRLGDHGTLFLVAEDEPGNIAGFALTYPDDEPEPWLESLHVIRESRGSGIGSLLMRVTAERLIALGHNTMRLGVILGNSSAARFYERLGGEMIGLEPATWAPGVTHQVYRWADLTALAQKYRQG